MNYEDRYKHALERASKLRVQNPFDTVGQMVEYIFPELKESEDDRIRKDIIRVFKGEIPFTSEKENEKYIAWLEKHGEIDLEHYKDGENEKRKFVGYGFLKCKGDFLSFKEGKTYWLEYLGKDNYNVRSDNLLGQTFHIKPVELYTVFRPTTWLEKQGEKNTADKVESKFKPGDWIVDDKTPNDIFCVIEVLEEIYKVIDIDGDDYHIPHCKADKQFHLWTIQDAKDGDVFVNSKGQPFIFSGKYDDRNSGNPIAYCGVNCQNKFKISNGIHWTNKREVAPATKEQRDLLFQKMKEAGYEWDGDKKELKKIKSKKLDADKVVEWMKHCELHDWDILTTIIPDDSPTSNPHRVRRLTDDFINNFKKNLRYDQRRLR